MSLIVKTSVILAASAVLSSAAMAQATRAPARSSVRAKAPAIAPQAKSPALGNSGAPVRSNTNAAPSNESDFSNISGTEVASSTSLSNGAVKKAVSDAAAGVVGNATTSLSSIVAAMTPAVDDITPVEQLADQISMFESDELRKNGTTALTLAYNYTATTTGKDHVFTALDYGIENAGISATPDTVYAACGITR